jgi:RND family efflux transporter MFP subunit
MIKNNFLFIISLLILAVGCNSKGNEPEEKADSVNVAAPVETILLKKGILNSSLQIPGELIAFQQVDIYAKENSFVQKLYVDVGSEVKAGQLLAVMEAPEINSQLNAAASRLKSQEAVYIASKASYNRLLETSKTPGTVAPNDLDLALAKMNSDEAQLEAAKAAYAEIGDRKQYLQIRAPFGGVISARNVNTGAYVGPSGKGSEFPLFTLQEQNKLRLVVPVPEAYTRYLHQNDSVYFTVNAFPNTKLSARVARFAGALDERLRSQRVEMDVPNPKKKLLPRMIAEVQLPLSTTDSTFIVPSTALVNSTERIFVIKVDQGKAQWVDVKKGREVNDNVEVFGDLKAGDSLVKNASEEVRDGSAIASTK